MKIEERQYMWQVLIEKSSEREEGDALFPCHLSVCIYDGFLRAKKAMDLAIQNYAHIKNSIFDGNGGIIPLQEWLEKIDDAPEAHHLPQLIRRLISNELDFKEQPEVKWRLPTSVGEIQPNEAGWIYFCGEGKEQQIYIHIYNINGLETAESTCFHIISKNPAGEKKWFMVEIINSEVNEPLE